MENKAQTAAIKLPWQGTADEVAANIATGSLRESLLVWLKTERGVHAETLLASIGALAGFAAQTAALARVAKQDIPLPPGAAAPLSPDALGEHLRKSGLLVGASTKSGETFYFGDLINGYLVQQAVGEYPLWGFVAAAAIEGGAKAAELPDCSAMFRRAAQTAGTPEFGALQVVRQHQPQITPRQALDLFWPRAKSILTRTDGPGPAKGQSVPVRYWATIHGIVARQLIVMTKNTLDPRVGFALVMESAIMMSKVDPATVPQDIPAKPPSQ
jgi:hypothetical protein